MDSLIVWMKKNQLLAGAIALLIVSALYSQFLSGPRSYEDCVLIVVKEAHDYILVLIPAIFFHALNDVQKKFLTQIGHS